MISGAYRPASVCSLISEFQDTMGHFYLKRTVFQRITYNIPLAFIHMHVHSHVYVYIIYEHIYICIETLLKGLIIKVNLKFNLVFVIFVSNQTYKQEYIYFKK